MSTSGSSASSDSGKASTAGIDSEAYEYLSSVVDYRFLLAQPGTRLLPDISDYHGLWILVGPEDDNGWNEWKVAYYHGYKRGDDDEWLAARTEWWWGEYIDRDEGYTSWFVQQWLERADSEVGG